MWQDRDRNGTTVMNDWRPEGAMEEQTFLDGEYPRREEIRPQGFRQTDCSLIKRSDIMVSSSTKLLSMMKALWSLLAQFAAVKSKNRTCEVTMVHT